MLRSSRAEWVVWLQSPMWWEETGPQVCISHWTSQCQSPLPHRLLDSVQTGFCPFLMVNHFKRQIEVSLGWEISLDFLRNPIPGFFYWLEAADLRKSHWCKTLRKSKMPIIRYVVLYRWYLIYPFSISGKQEPEEKSSTWLLCSNCWLLFPSNTQAFL